MLYHVIEDIFGNVVNLAGLVFGHGFRRYSADHLHKYVVPVPESEVAVPFNGVLEDETVIDHDMRNPLFHSEGGVEPARIARVGPLFVVVGVRPGRDVREKIVIRYDQRARFIADLLCPSRFSRPR